jgi:hypothetical protein
MGYGSGTCESVLFLNGRCASLGLVRSSYFFFGPDSICIVAVKLILCETFSFQELLLNVCHGELFLHSNIRMSRIKFGNCGLQNGESQLMCTLVKWLDLQASTLLQGRFLCILRCIQLNLVLL